VETSTLWTFGDSYTFGFACREDCPSGKALSYMKYKKKDDDIWPNLLSRDLNFNLQNLGKNSYCNYDIIESIIDNIKNINQDDIVVIFKTIPQRLKHPLNDEWKFIPNDVLWQCYENDKGNEDFTKEQIKSIVPYYTEFFNQPAVKNRQNKIYNHLIDTIKSKKVKVVVEEITEKEREKHQTIEKHTNGEIYDFHFSYNGHQSFYKHIKSKLKLDKSIL
jgi:hypothetical protein